MFLVKVSLRSMWHDLLAYVLIPLNFARAWTEFVFDQRFPASLSLETALLSKADIEIFFWHNSTYPKLISLHCSHSDAMDNWLVFYLFFCHQSAAACSDLLQICAVDQGCYTAGVEVEHTYSLEEA